MEKIICSSCGKEIDQGVRFCPACGAAVGGTDTAKSENVAAGSNWMRDVLIIAGVGVVVIIGYLVLRQKPSAPPPPAAAEMPGHENMPTEMLKDMPQGYAPLVDYGNQQMDHENYAVAAEAYRRALQIDSSSADVRSDFASCLHAMGLPKRAAEEFRKIITASPDHAIAYFNLGIVFHGMKEMDSARYYWEKYLAMDPQGPAVESARQLLKELGK